MKIATPEIRTIVVNAYLYGIASRQQLADIFGYHVGSIGRWIREGRQDKRLSLLPRGHRISVFSHEERARLADYIEKNPDATLAEIREHFGKSCSLLALHKITRSLGYVFKKTLKASEQEREDMARSREERKRSRRKPPGTKAAPACIRSRSQLH